MTLSIIIVHYKVKGGLYECIQSLYRSNVKLTYEIIVVDNDEDHSIEKEIKKQFPKVRYIKSSHNVGYGAGNNLGAVHAKGEYLFFLNPDTKVQKNTVDRLVQFLEKEKDAAIVAPLLLDISHNAYPQGSSALTPLTALVGLSFINKIFPQNPISREYFLKDWDMKKIKEVAVVPGTAFMIRKKIFTAIDGFDENYFLYFEESDICKRVRELGEKIYIYPEAKVVHIGAESTKQRNDIRMVFDNSRRYYFKKHYGAAWAGLIEMFLGFRKEDLLLLGVLALAIFLRVYRIDQMFSFSGEVGHNLLAIKNAFSHREIPLLGPPTSHPWLSFGPLFYWIYGPILYLSKFNPISHAYFGAFFSIIIIILNYYVIRSFLDKKTALLSSYLMTISPLFMTFAQGSRFFFIVTLLVYPFLYCLVKICRGEKKYVFWLGLVFGSMFSFHFSPLLLLPFAILSLAIYKVKLQKKDIVKLFIGIFIPMIPFFIYDGLHSLLMTKNLLLWIPYRIAGFLGMYPKNTLNEKVLHENVLSLVDFFITSFVPIQYSLLGYIVLFLLLIFTVLNYKKLLLKKNFMQFVYIWLACGYAAVFIHGSPPIHYFVPLLPVPIILFSFFLGSFWDNKEYKLFIFLALVGLTILDGLYYFSPQWYYSSYQHTGKSYYSVLQSVARTIITDAKGSKYVLHRIGPDDQFEGDYAQNYVYLLWLYGNEPVEKADTTYVIVEQPERIGKAYEGATAFLHVGTIIIIKIPTVLMPKTKYMTMSL